MQIQQSFKGQSKIQLEIDKKSVVYVSKYEKVFDTNRKLLDVFCAFGVIDVCIILKDQAFERHGYIQYADPADAQRAIKGNFHGRIKVGLLTGKTHLESDVELDVTNLPIHFTENDLFDMFEEFGRILSCVVIKKEANVFGIVRFGSPDDAYRAKMAIHGKEFQRKRVSVNFCHKKGHHEEYLVALKFGLRHNAGIEFDLTVLSKLKRFCALYVCPAMFSSRYLICVERRNNPVFCSSIFDNYGDGQKITSESHSFFIAPTANTTSDEFLIPVRKEITAESHSPFTPLSKRNTNPFVVAPKMSPTIPFIEDKMFLEDVLAAKVEKECKKYADSIVRTLKNRSIVDINTLIKDDGLLKDEIKEKLRNLAFD